MYHHSNSLLLHSIFRPKQEKYPEREERKGAKQGEMQTLPFFFFSCWNWYIIQVRKTSQSERSRAGRQEGACARVPGPTERRLDGASSVTVRQGQAGWLPAWLARLGRGQRLKSTPAARDVNTRASAGWRGWWCRRRRRRTGFFLKTNPTSNSWRGGGSEVTHIVGGNEVIWASKERVPVQYCQGIYLEENGSENQIHYQITNFSPSLGLV